MVNRLNRRQFIQATALSAGAALLASCAPVAPAAPAAGEAVAGSAATGGGTLVFGYPQRTTFGNFCVPWNYAGTQDVYQRRLAISGLIQWNNDYSGFLPDLAESWSFDGNTCIFNLRQGVTWHDGAPFGADDVIFTFQIVAHPDSLWTDADNLKLMVQGFTAFNERTATDISGIRKIDDFTVAFDLTDAYRDPFLDTVASYVMNPKHLLSDKPLDELLPEEGLCKTTWALETGIGTGPFKVAAYVPDQYIEFLPNENYYRGEIQLDKLIYTAYTDAQAQAAALESGECHVGTIPPSEYPRFLEMDHVNILLNSGLANTAFFFNTNTVPLRVRQAMFWALDREAIVDSFYSGATTVADAIFEYGGFGVGPNVQRYTYDPDKARALLQEEGWDTNRKLRFMLDAITPSLEPLFTLALGYWAEVGIQVEYQVVGADYGNIQMEAEGTDLLFSGQVWGANPSVGAAYYLNEMERMPFIDLEESAEIVQRISLSSDQEEIKQGVYRLQELGAEYVTVLPIARTPGIWVINKKVKGNLNPIYALWTRNDWGWESVTVEG